MKITRFEMHSQTSSILFLSPYSFQGMEKDNEVKGEGNSYDFSARMLDSRVGRFLSLDPDKCKYPYLSPYCFASNSPIMFLDAEGKGIVNPKPPGHDGNAFIYISNYILVVDGVRVNEVHGTDSQGNSWVYKSGTVTFQGDIESNRVSEKTFILQFDTQKSTAGNTPFNITGMTLTNNTVITRETSFKAGGGPKFGGRPGNPYDITSEDNADKAIESFDSHIPEIIESFGLDESAKLTGIEVILTGKKRDIAKAKKIYTAKLKENYPEAKISFVSNRTTAINNNSVQIMSTFKTTKLSSDSQKVYDDAGAPYEKVENVPEHSTKDI